MATEERKKVERGGHKSSATEMIMRMDNMLAAPKAVDTTSLIQLEISIKKKLHVGEIISVKWLDAEMFYLSERKKQKMKSPRLMNK